MQLESLHRLAEDEVAHSRTRYADLYDFSPVGYASLDEGCRIEEINITGGKLLGENPHQLIGKIFADFVVPDDVDRFTSHISRIRRSWRKHRIELRLATRHGAVIDVELYTMATQDADRSTLQFRMAILDITRRKRAEEERRRQREEAQRFLNDATAVLSASLDYETILWSLARAAVPDLADCAIVDMLEEDSTIRRAAAAHFNSQKLDLIWKLERYPPDRWAAFGRAKVIRTGRPELYAQVSDTLLEAIAENESHLKLLLELEFKSFMCVPLVVRGKVIGCIEFMLERPERQYGSFDLLLAEDLADRAAIAIDNAMLYSKEQEANRVKDEFLATVSHELRTPLTPILGAIFKLKAKRRDDAELMAVLDMIERNAKTQSRIVEDLLDISRITTGKLEFKRQVLELKPIVESALEVVRPAADALGIQLETVVDKLPRPIHCDRDRIQQVVWNLLSNAIKFTPSGGRIRVRLEDRHNVARIRVTDNGIGIRPDFLPHVFDRFRQEDSFTTRLHGGLGLGLSIVRYVVERHGGSVRAESDGEGRGATFIVDLPYSRVS